MKTLVIVGDHPRNLGLLEKLLNNNEIDICGLILFKREKMIPEPSPNLNLKLKKLWKIHFEKRSKSEEKYFSLNFSYENKISNILKVNNDLEFNSTKVVEFVNTLKADVCFLTGVPIIKDPLFSALPQYSINLHLGIIPFYKGSITMFWPFYFLEPTMAGTTYHIIDKYVDTGEILHNNVPKLQRGDGIHDVASKAVVEAHKDIDLIVQKIKKRIDLSINPKKDVTLRLKGKLFTKSDWKPEMLNLIYEYYDDKIVDLYLDNIIICPKPKLINIDNLSFDYIT